MDIHEYQAKELLARFGVPVPRGAWPTARTGRLPPPRSAAGTGRSRRRSIPAAAARPAASSCAAPTDVAAAAKALLGSALVTHQTGPRGKVVYRLYIEPAEPSSASSTSASCSTGRSNASV